MGIATVAKVVVVKVLHIVLSLALIAAAVTVIKVVSPRIVLSLARKVAEENKAAHTVVVVRLKMKAKVVLARQIAQKAVTIRQIPKKIARKNILEQKQEQKQEQKHLNIQKQVRNLRKKIVKIIINIKVKVVKIVALMHQPMKQNQQTLLMAMMSQLKRKSPK